MRERRQHDRVMISAEVDLSSEDNDDAAAPPRPAAPPRTALWSPPALTLDLALETASPLADSPAQPDVEALPVFEDLDAAFSAMLDAAAAPAPRSPAKSSPDGPPADVRELFAALASNHMKQVRDFMISVRWGEPLSDWVGICGPAVKSLMRAAREMGFASLHSALGDFVEALTLAGAESIDGVARERLVSAYERVSAELPEAFATEEERSRREAVIVHSLLLQVPELTKVSVDKLYAAGLTSLDVLFLAEPDDIAATTGIRGSLASRIVDRFQSYRREVLAPPLSPQRSVERERLRAAAIHMGELHDRYEQAAAGWTDQSVEDKKRLRHARSEAFLEVKVLLARLGEFDRIAEIERLPFSRKIEQLDTYVREHKTLRAL
jgi:hypothetical protein